MSQENEAVVDRLVTRFWNQQDFGLLDELATPGFRHHEADGKTRDREAYKDLLREFRAFEGGFTVADTLVDADKVAIRWIWRGTQQSDFHGAAPAGQAVEVPGQTILHFSEGRIVEMWSSWNLLDFMQQLGFRLQPPSTP